MADRSQRAVRELGRRIAALEKGNAQRKLPQLAHSSIENGGITEYGPGSDDNPLARFGKQYDGTHTATSLAGPIPPAPSAPTVSEGNVGMFSVTWDGTFAGALVAPLDYARVEVHVGHTSDFIPDTLPQSVTRFGTIEPAGGGKVAINHDAGDYFTRLVTRTQSGKFSDPSDPVPVHVDSPLNHDDVVVIIGQAGTGNRVYYSTTEPDGDGVAPGDTWRQLEPSPGTNIVAEWRWDGNGWVAQQLTGDLVANLDAGKITAGVIQAAVSIGSLGSVTSGDNVDGPYAGLFGDASIRAYRKSMDGDPYLSVSLGGDADNQLEFIQTPDEPPVASISAAGDASFATGTFEGDVSIGGSALLGSMLDPDAQPGILDAFPGGAPTAYDFRALPAMSSTIGQGTTGLLGQFGVTLPAGRRVELRMPWRVNPAKVSGTTPTELVFACRAFWTYTTDGSEPPVPTPADGASVLASDDKRTGISRATGVSGILTATVDVPVAIRAKVLIGIYTDTGTQVTPSTYSPTSWVAYLHDHGPAVDPLAAVPPGSGSQQQFTTTWTATDSRCWDQNGAIVGGAHNVHLGQGVSGSTTMHAAFVCNGNASGGDEKGKTMAAALTGATVLKVEVGVQSTSWGELPAELNLMRFSGAALSSPDKHQWYSTYVRKPYTARSQWQWTTDPSMSAWISATNRGIYIGPPQWMGPSTHAQLASAFYATTSQRPQIRVTYARAVTA